MEDFDIISEQITFEQVLENFCLTGKIGDDWFSQSHEIYNMTFSEAVQYLTNNWFKLKLTKPLNFDLRAFLYLGYFNLSGKC